MAKSVADDINRQFGERVRAKRLKAKLTLRDLGAQTGVAHVSIMMIERGSVRCGLGTAMKLAKALNIKLDSLAVSAP